MTRVTSFGFGKRTHVLSTAEEAAQAEVAAPEPVVIAAPVEAEAEAPGAGKKRRRGKKAKKVEAGGEDGEKKEGVTEGISAAVVEPVSAHTPVVAQSQEVAVVAGPSKGWGKDPEIVRKMQKAEERRLDRINEKHTNTTCFACRSKGHAAKDCPNVLLAASIDDGWGSGKRKAEDGGDAPARTMKRAKGKKGADVAGTGGRCYRCDSSEHPLSRCPKPASAGLPFASCFICLEKGHLASQCPSNQGRGIYPNGGCCKVCSSVQHRASDCPDDKRGKPAGPGVTQSMTEVLELEKKLTGTGKGGEMVVGTGGAGMGADEDDFMVVRRQKAAVEKEETREKERRKKEKGGKFTKQPERVEAVDQATSATVASVLARPVKKAKVVTF